MDYVKIVLNDNFYCSRDSNNRALKLLSYFFTDDVSLAGIESWIKWLLDDRFEDTASNFTFVDKEGDTIVIGCQFSDDPYEWIVELQKDQLIYLLNQWHQLLRLKPREIIITRENGQFNMEGIW